MLLLIRGFALTVVGFALIFGTTGRFFHTNAQVDIVQRCGEEVARLPNFSLLQLEIETQQRELVSVTSSDGELSKTRLITWIDDSIGVSVNSTDIMILGGGEAVVLIERDELQRNADITVISQDGEAQFYTENVDGINWWGLVPEYVPGRFHILGYTDQAEMVIVEAVWENGSLEFGQPTPLPFTFDFTSLRGRAYLNLSPDGDIVGYYLNNPDPDSNLAYALY